jgi:poly-gamma-glutamate synthesis protein (capsule biosynthesis protein)
MGQPIRIVAVGDLSFNGRYSRILRRKGVHHPFRFLLPSWQDADLLLGNLESPLTTSPKVSPAKVTLRGARDAPASLRVAGFDCLALANNHLMDYGVAGMEETRAALDAAGIPFTGAGTDAAASLAPVVLHRQEQSIGVLSFCLVEQKSHLFAGRSTPGVAPLEVADAVGRIRDLRSRVDWVVVQLHWGEEMTQLPTPEQRSLARTVAEAGADLIVGHHPHVLQPFEMVGGVPVFYSLGNFLFSDMYWRGRTEGGEAFVSKLRLHPLSRRTGWAEVILERGRPAVAAFHPARLRRDLAVVPAPTEKRRREWQRLCERLHVADYEREAQEELLRGRERTRWRWAWKALHRRIELKLFELGLIPWAAEGD